MGGRWEALGEALYPQEKKKTSSGLDRWAGMPLTEIACISNWKGPLSEKRKLLSKA